MKRYVMIQFNQDNGNLLERYVDFSQLHKCIISYLSVSSDAYAFERESMDREVLEFIYKLNYEFEYARILEVRNACFGENYNKVKSIEYIIEILDF